MADVGGSSPSTPTNTAFLKPLPAPKEEDLARGILESIDMDSYRVEKQSLLAIAVPDEDSKIGPVPTAGGGHKPESELDRLRATSSRRSTTSSATSPGPTPIAYDA